MDARENKTLSELVTLVKSWIPWRSEPAHVSRDFWMPDQSCRVCYDCDSQFTIFNRRHHCRLCGRVFCGKCTANSIPASFADSRSPPEECEKIRVCSYCFKQWKDGIATPDNSIPVANRDISTSPSVDSIVSTKSTGTVNSESFTLGSMPCLSGPYQRVQYSSGISSHQPSVLETSTYGQGKLTSRKSSDLKADMGDHPHRLNRNDNDTDDYGIYQTDSETRRFPPINYYSQAEFDEMSNDDGSQKLHPDVEYIDAKSLSSSPLFQDSFNSPCLEEIQQPAKKDENDIGDECEAPSSLYAAEDVDAEPVDFENNGLLWLPPEPEDEEDEREDALFDDDDGGEEAAGEWGYQRTSSFGSGEYRNKDKSSEEHKKAMKNVVDGHFRALVSQLLQVENLPVGDEDGQGSWLEIITSLSWEAAHLLKPDTSTGGGMDPGGYVKVKCIASGRHSDSMVLKGVVCKKNVAHRRMTSKIEKPRLLILGGALEYQRVSNLLSSFDTLLQQEMDHLKMAVAKIAAHHPNILLVEKSVSRFAQEYLLAKDISLALNIKRPLLERIARCTGAQIVPSIDHLSSQKLGYCENFHVERFVEDLGAAGQGGKKLVKTLMYFEGCPKPFGCTILLRGANGDELKKVKHVVQYGVFAAYHLALETSFLADEGASLPELPFNSPITVALPDKPSSIERSISTVPGFSVPTNEKSSGPQPIGEPLRSNSVPTADLPSSIRSALDRKMEMIQTPCLSNGCSLQMVQTASSFTNAASPVSSAPSEEAVSIDKMLSPGHLSKEKNETSSTSSEHMVVDASIANNFVAVKDDGTTVHDFGPLEAVGQGGAAGSSGNDHNTMIRNQPGAYGVSSMQQDNNNNLKEPATLKEEFPPSPNDHQSILVSLSSRCVWKGTICERSHLFRIKYYGSFDKPLGRFLRDHLFDQSYRCRSCEMPSEAHVHCYTHRQGTLTISVKRLPEILLPGEREGKIWMWHRCLRCPRVNGFPPATRRVVMSDAAWGLSFGKFLELSFSNHAAASRVACCGHSLHRDCLRFYGFGKMVACFLYATIDVHSVYLPPPKLDFSSENQEWIQKESDEVVEQAELLFSEVLNSLSQITAEGLRVGPLSSGIKTSESRHRVAELERLLQREKADFEEDVQKVVNREVKKGQPVIDILEINRLRRQLLFQSYVWDQRLNNAASLDNKRPQNGFGSASPEQGKPLVKSEKILDLNVADSHKEGHHSSDSFLVDPKLHKSPDHEELGENTNQLDAVHEEDISVGDSNHEKEDQAEFSSHSSISYQSDPLGSRKDVYRALSDGQIPVLTNLSDSLDAAWTGESHPRTRFPKDNSSAFPDSAVTDSLTVTILSERLDMENTLEGHDGPKLSRSVSPALPTKSFENLEDSVIRLGLPFWNLYRSINKNFLASSQKLNTPGHYHPVYISSFRESQLQGGARLLLPLGVDDIVVPVYDDEPTSIIAYALASPQYHLQLSDEGERPKDSGDSVASLPSDAIHNQTHSVDETTISSYRSLGSTDDSILSTYGSHSLLVSDPLSYTKAFHARVTLEDDGPLGKVNFSVTCYYAMRFEALRRICCTSELDYIRSLSRCKKWGAQGGKSNVFFAKTLDDRFIIKQVTKTELESFIKFAPAYFKYLSESVSTKSPTCLAKILGIYQVTAKHLKGGKESKMDVLVMENLLFGRSVMRLYDLKGSSRSRYNPDSSGSNKVLLDQNLIESMPTSPIFVGNKAKRLLERAVWNDTAFLASVDVMDYSLLVGVDEEKHELVLGIIDFMRQYTWDKHLETWVKASGILGGPKNASPTVISPKQYKKRFRKAMTMYFLMVPDQWSTPYTIPSKCPSDICEDSSQGGTTVE